MSVLIKGMEMPSNCAECPLSHDAECAVKNCMVIDDCYVRRASWCPLLPVPDHGDLIDRDAALYNLGRIVLPDDLAYTIGHDMAKRFFEKAPTIIPADKESEK